jgi:hypothetical protein
LLLSSQESLANPFPLFAAMRDEAPVQYDESVRGWVVTGHEQVVAALRHPALSSDRISPFMRDLPAERLEKLRPLWDSLSRWSVFADAPSHTQLRALFQRAFAKRAVEHMRRRIEERVDELLRDVRQADGPIDFIAAFAYPLPALVICELLGLPRSDLEDIRHWSDDIATFIGLPLKPAHTYDAALSADRALADYFGRHLAERRARPSEDLISRLASAADETDGAVGDQEIIATCGLLLFAAHTTTTHLIGNGLLALLRHSEQLALLRADASLVPGAVEELLRYDGPIQAVRRQARTALELGGARIPAGALVFSMINAANRDPRAFPDPDELDVRRPAGKQIAFGAGAHFCTGAPLARLEAQVAFEALTRPALHFEIVDSEPLEWLDTFGFRGLRRFMVRLRDPSATR